jgi:uncharacterized damage-inducible protein DinB
MAIIDLRPVSGHAPRIGLFLAQMEDVRTVTKRYIEDLKPEQLSWHPNPKVESIGTLLLHIAAVEFSWILEDIFGRPMGAEWEIAFPIRAGMSQVSGQPLLYFSDKLDAVRGEVRSALATLTDADLDRVIIPQDSGVSAEEKPGYTIRWILHHLVEHEAHHRGQIAVMKRLLPI